MLKRAFSGFADVLRAVAAFGIALAVAINLAQIVYRYVLFDPLAWTEEAMRYLMVWVTMLGAAASLYRGEEASAGLLGSVPSRAFQAFLHLFRIALVLVFGVLLAWFGLPFALAAKSQVSPAAQIPMIWPNLALFAGGVAIVAMAVGMLVAPATPAESDSVRPEDMT